MSVYNLLASAISDPSGQRGRSEGYKFLFSEGDLCQMSSIDRFLTAQGLSIGRVNVYPAVKTEEEFKRGLELIWKEKVEGWWNYGHKFIENKTCTKEEFDAALQRL